MKLTMNKLLFLTTALTAQFTLSAINTDEELSSELKARVDERIAQLNTPEMKALIKQILRPRF